MKFLSLFLLLSGTSVFAQKERCLMPQGWYNLKPFGWKPGVLSDSSMHRITVIKINLDIQHSWGGGVTNYMLEYRLRDSFFETYTTHFKYSGKEHPPKQKGQGANVRDSFFEQRFESERLFRVLHGIQYPSPYWSEADFGYTRSTFRFDLMQLLRTKMSGYRNCEDCSDHGLKIQFFMDNNTSATIAPHWFDSGFRLPRVEDTGLKEFKVLSMLEWMYLYQLCHLFFPKNEVLNKSHFHEKSMEWLTVWAKKFFPELNN